MPLAIRFLIAWSVVVQIGLLIIAGAIDAPQAVQLPLCALLGLELMILVGVIIHDNTSQAD